LLSIRIGASLEVAVPEDGFAGRVVIVTGGGGAIGRGLVRHLGRSGAKVVVAEWKPELLEAAVAELEVEKIPCLGVVCDVGKRASIESMVDQTMAKFNRVDALVNNAMTLQPGQPLAQLSEEALDVSLVSGVKGTLWGMQAVYPHMKKAGWGRIVNVGSSAGLIGFKGMGAYAAAKEAIRSLTRTAAREWFQDGIVVNLYCPVAVEVKGRSREVSPQPPPDDFRGMAMNVLATLSPTTKDGDPELDLGPTVAFLCSDACRYLTGQTLTLDGGAYAFA
jgi:NAD(P)-dependent dehydrogenase (short-subunit alcohol dehydrogenase family)